MKSLVTLFVSGVFALTLLTGCATTTSSYGTDFSDANVSKIVKGKTTSAQLIELFGQPFQKTPVSATEEHWMYTYTTAQSEAKPWMFGTNVKTTSTAKTLYVLLKNGVVINYTYTPPGTQSGTASSSSP